MEVSQHNFPIKSTISFFKLIESLEQLVQEGDEHASNYAKGLLDIVEKHPQLNEGINTIEELEQYKEPIDILSRSLFPSALTTNEIKALTAPFRFIPIRTSTRFGKILEDTPEDYQFELITYDEETFYKMACMAIMGVHYKFPSQRGAPMIVAIPNKTSGKTAYFRVAINIDLCELKPTSSAKDITEEDFQLLSDNFDDFDLWKEKFPPNSWEMKGLGVINLMDVTPDQAISEIISNLLYKDVDTFDKIQENIRVYLGLDDLVSGFTGFQDGLFSYSKKKSGFNSILLDKEGPIKCTKCLDNDAYQKMIVQKKPITITDTAIYAEHHPGDFINILINKGIESYIGIPIVHNDEILGVMELGSKTKRVLNTFASEKLNAIIPAISMTTARYRSENNNRIEAIIQKECTTIHESVKWKFVEQAQQYLLKEDAGEQPSLQDIILDDVYPLYAQMDIKDSSLKRNTAITLDLINQLETIVNILEAAYKQQPLPTIEELISSGNEHVENVRSGLLASTEHQITSFLLNEVYPMFNLLKDISTDVQALIVNYQDTLDRKEGVLYSERKKWDESVALCNKTLAKFIDEKQLQAQQIFPHYFERYNTDGLEYNIYIGDSIAQQKTFNDLYLDNLRLWQLQTMCEMEQEFKNIQPELKTAIEVATLILAYGSPFTIHFKMDEKRFDVDGAYNARYEIIKKRVDKALIKDTKERITKPNHICIIYSSSDEKKIYQKHIHFLEQKGLIEKDTLEDHMLQDLQGITGLKALRFKVNVK
ncbi:GAF domain-containing protein [Cyclobacteriaceae bacterium]|nr:GAF domain-containing protein [Cyclobacteriaceae bacterium]